MAEVKDFARKYRPSRLSEYIGNKTIVATALRFLSRRVDGDDKLPQVVLLHGHAGCGKTTFARILCSCYCCENILPTGDACGECDSCKEFINYIETGDTTGLMDIYEVDSAILNGKEDIELLVEEMSQPSITGGWKCYIFDECHRLSQQAQSALLKTIEEPPEKVFICLCTTEANKLLKTILSRVNYDLKVTKPTSAELVQLLAKVCQQEKIKADTRALALIALKADYVPRNALKLLARVATEQGSILYDDTAKTLNIIAEKYYFAFYEFMTQKTINTYQYLAFISKLKQDTTLAEFIEGLTGFTIRGIYIYNNIAVDGIDASEFSLYAKLFAKFDPSELAFMLDWLTKMRTAPDLELQLMLLGYKGMRGAIQKTAQRLEESPNELDASLAELSKIASSAEKDTNANVEARNSQVIDADKDLERIMQEQSAPLNDAEMLDMFAGSRVVTDLP